MGIFGSGSPAAAIPYDPSQLTPNDKLFMVGAMLKDAGSALHGGDSNNVMGARQFLMQRQLLNARQQFLGGMFGAGAPGASGVPVANPTGPLSGDVGAPPAQTMQSAPLSGDYGPAAQAPVRAGPRMLTPQQVMLGDMLGFNMGDVIKAQELGKVAVGPNGQVYGEYDPSMVGQNLSASQYINNWRVNPNDPRAPAYLPTAPVDGAVPVRTPQGLDWAVPPGAERALDIKNKAAIMRGEAALAEVPIAARNAATGAAAQANTASQNVVAPPPGFTPLPRRKR